MFSDRSIEVLLPALLGNYDRPTDQPNRPTDRREVKLRIIYE